MTALDVYTISVARGIVFRLVAHDEFQATGPKKAVDDMFEVIHVYRNDLIALIQEFCSPSASAQDILSQSSTPAPKASRRKPKATKVISQKLGPQQLPLI